MANDPTVKAGSWGARTVEKIVRLTEHALRHELPVVLPRRLGRRAHHRPGRAVPGPAGRGPHLRQPGAAVGQGAAGLLPVRAVGGRRRVHPGFCDVVFMVEGNASMYLGSPRMAEMVIGEQVTLEEMGGARMHATVSGCGDNLARRRRRRDRAGEALVLVPADDLAARPPPAAEPSEPRASRSTGDVVPDEERRAYDMHKVIDGLVDDGSFFEVKPLWARELIVGFGRLDGQAVGIVANNPMHQGGVLFVDSADKAARFIWLCDAFNVPLLFLADVPGLHDRHRRSSGRASSATAPR